MKAAVAALIILTILIVAEVLLGRSWWCAGGDWRLWVSDTASSHTSQHLFDPYSFSHIQHGMIFYFVLWLFSKRVTAIRIPWILVALVIEVMWEIIENSPFIIERYRTATISLDYFGDSIGNSLGDVLSCALGFVIASRIKPHWSVILYLIFEIGMLVTIRDCLSLNVLMLIYPVEAIKTWQSLT